MFASIAIRLMSALLSSRNHPPLRVRIICGKFPFRARCCGGWGQPPSREGACPHAPPNRGDRLACMKKERTVPFMHSAEARPKAHPECMKRQCAHAGASSLACRSGLKCLDVFLLNDLLALMLNFQAPGGSRECKIENGKCKMGRGVAKRLRNFTFYTLHFTLYIRLSVFRTMFPRRATRLAG